MRDLLQKLNNLRRKYGAAEALRLLARSLFRAAEARLGPGLRDCAAVEGLLRELRAGGFERVVLRLGGFGWHTPLVQRAQQLARAMGRRGCLVLYEAAPPHERLRGAEKLGEGLWLVNLRSPRLRRTIERAVCDSAKPRYVMAASPESRLGVGLLRRYERRGWVLLYDYIDAISGEISGGTRTPRRTLALYRHAMEDPRSRIVVSSLALLRDAGARGRAALLVENGVDFAHFSRPGPCPEDESFRALLRRGRPLVCYYGALARWLDYAALRAIAADGRFDLLLLGVRYDASFDEELAGRENVFFLGAKPYAVLKDYASRCDVLLIPFRRGEVGDAASPVKLFEYLATGRPVVAGDVAECRRCKSVLIASDAADYVRCIERALACGEDPVRLAAAREEGSAADWLRRAETLCAALRAEERKEG